MLAIDPHIFVAGRQRHGQVLAKRLKARSIRQNGAGDPACQLALGKLYLFGGTSLLIMVGVGLDTVKQIESQLQQRNYEGFLR